MHKILIAVPLHRRADLIEGLFSSLREVGPELAVLKAEVVFINDSPDDADLATELAARLPALQGAIRTALWVNDENLGFAGSCNRALRQARDEGADVLLLHADARLTAGALTEIARVALLDPMTSVVSPRSNNAGICNSPYPDRFRALGLGDAHAAHRAIQDALPRVTYVPTVAGFCLFIRHLMLSEFGLFETGGGGHREEEDFILRCSQRGYRAVLANRAFVHHIGTPSFSPSAVALEAREAKDGEHLPDRSPGYSRSVERYVAGAEFRTQSLLAGLIPSESGRRRILFDCRAIDSASSSTVEYARSLMRAMVLKHHRHYEFFIACSHRTLVEHGLDTIHGLDFCWGHEPQMAPFAAAFRLSQPSRLDEVVSVAELAPVSGCLMSDGIAMDGQELDANDPETVWQTMLDVCPLVAFTSDDARTRFARRFAIPADVVTGVSLCSTDADDYVVPGARAQARSVGDQHLLIVGSHDPHGAVRDLLARLAGREGRPKIAVLGLAVEPMDDVVSYGTGKRAPPLVDSLYDNASAVLLPSHDEGFGLPVMQALARRRPLIGRDRPVVREIMDRTPFGQNLHLYQTIDEMAAAALAPPVWRDGDAPPPRPVHGWEQAGDAMIDLVERALAALSIEAVRARVLRLDIIRDALRPLPPPAVVMAEPPPPPPPPPAPPAPRPRLEDPERLLRAAYDAVKGQSLDRMQREKARRFRWTKETPADPAAEGISVDLASYAAPDLRQGLQELHVVAHGDGRHGHVLGDALLDWASALPFGGVLRLDIVARPDDGADNRLSGEELRVCLLNAGLYPEAIAPGGGGLSTTALKVSDWRAALPGPGDDMEFLAMIYKTLLGRPIDEDGAATYRADLGAGLSREGLARILLLSEERRQSLSESVAAQAD